VTGVHLSFDLMVGAGTGIVALAALVAWSTFRARRRHGIWRLPMGRWWLRAAAIDRAGVHGGG